MSCGLGCRHSLDLALLWLWHRPEATAPIRPLSWEPPYAMGAALKKNKKRRKKKVPRLGVESEAAAAGHGHSHSHMGSELHLQPTQQLTAMVDP